MFIEEKRFFGENRYGLCGGWIVIYLENPKFVVKNGVEMGCFSCMSPRTKDAGDYDEGIARRSTDSPGSICFRLNVCNVFDF